MKFGTLDGMKVVSLDAKNVGEVTGIEIDEKKWIITHIHIELSDDALDELKFKKPFIGKITICLPVGFINKVGDVISLSRTVEGLRRIPECR
jgi:sporulation protein YlmC with PRC-barrel domain